MRVENEISKPRVNRRSETPICDNEKRLSYDGIKPFPTIPKIIPLTRYPTTGGSFTVLAANPPINAAITSIIISLMNEACIIY